MKIKIYKFLNLLFNLTERLKHFDKTVEKKIKSKILSSFGPLKCLKFIEGRNFEGMLIISYFEEKLQKHEKKPFYLDQCSCSDDFSSL